MDLKTKQLVEYVEKYYTTYPDVDEPSEDNFLALCLAVREQGKRARHAEEERDLFSRRIDELETSKQYLLSDRADVIKALAPYTDLDDSAVGSARDAAKRIIELERQLQERTDAAAAWDALAVARLKTINEQATKIQDLTIEVNQLQSLIGDDIS